MTELVGLAKEHFDEVPQLMLFYHDGGPDHRLTYYSVIISYICVFRWLNLDYLVAVQTAPNNSWLNPCERLMSILNLGLQCVSTTRQKCSAEIETKLKSCKSMSAIRDAAESDWSLKDAISTSLEPVISLVQSRVARLYLKENRFQVSEAATSDEIECLWSFDLIDSNLSISDTTKKNISATAKDFLKFIDSHCRIRHYSFQVKKCSDPMCCSPPRLPEELFKDMKWLPDPLLTADKAHYKTFQELYRQDTTECDRPSLAIQREKEKEPSSLFTMAIESNVYVCGSPLFPEHHPLLDKLRIRTNLTCQSPIERSYYSNKTLHLPSVCAHCGEKECTVPQEMQERYKVVLPTCQFCTNKGLNPITYMPIKVGTKRKAVTSS